MDTVWTLPTFLVLLLLPTPWLLLSSQRQDFLDDALALLCTLHTLFPLPGLPLTFRPPLTVRLTISSRGKTVSASALICLPAELPAPAPVLPSPTYTYQSELLSRRLARGRLLSGLKLSDPWCAEEHPACREARKGHK